MIDKKKIVIVGVGSSSIEKAMAALAMDHKVVIVEATDRLKDAVEQFNQASLASENLNKALADLKALAPKLLAKKDASSSSKPFYYNVPKYRKKQRRW